MKHRVVGRRLDRTTEHRTAMFRNLVTSLFRHERIVTTTPKAKEIKRFADRFITLAKQGTPHARRLANRDVRDVEVLNKLFETLGPRFKDRAGGYTRVVRVGRRTGDAAEMAMIELVERVAADERRRPTPPILFRIPRRQHMAVVLRLSRAGTHKAPFYHVVATDSRKPRDGRYLEDVGIYDPTQKPERIQLKADRVEHWLKVG